MADALDLLNPHKAIAHTCSEGTITLTPAARSDYWKLTYYEPTLDVANAPALVRPVEWSTGCCSVAMSFTPVHQFDQAGLFVYVDDTHWIKAGLEYVDGVCRLSVVVTNGFSDWSTQNWTHGPAVRLRLHRVRGTSFVVEAGPVVEGDDSSEFVMIRVAHLTIADGSSLRIGPYACVPGDNATFTATFTGLEYQATDGYHHKA